VKQYSGFNPLPGYAVNGELTLGENIADNSGLAIAWKAWKLSLGEGGSPVIEGFTGAQRFYLGWAQVWRNQVREAEIIRLLKVDPHSPGSVRANGTVVNQPGFEEAFGLKPGDALYRTTENQVIIW
jgi:predicted metalloendopeptidase